MAERGVMPGEGGRAQRPLPNKATGLQGVRGWLLGRREYAHPALRWIVTPLFRLAWIPFVINVSLDYRSETMFILFLTLIGLSIVADTVNTVLLRRQRRQSKRSVPTCPEPNAREQP